MKKVLKWIGIVVLGLVGLLVLLGIGVFVSSNGRMNATYDINEETVVIPTGEEALAQGKHVATVRGCNDCHTGNFGGGTLIDDPAIGQINPSNLTAGLGGIGSSYSDADWVRAIRHGVGPDSKPLLFMPAHEFYPLSDDDLGALIAYLKTVDTVDNEVNATQVGPLGRVLFLAGQFDLIPAEKIDHDAPRPVPPAVAVSPEYGAYMATGCVGCHGEGYSGGAIPGGPPGWPEAANLTPGGNLANWSEQEFVDTLRSGFTPEGKQLNSEFMPWPTYSQMTDTELKAVFAYLQSLPAKETGNR